jgi:hypothetical protein
MPMKVWFIKEVCTEIQTNKRKKHWKGVKQAMKYKLIKTLKGCKTSNEIQVDKNIERVQDRQ